MKIGVNKNRNNPLAAGLDKRRVRVGGAPRIVTEAANMTRIVPAFLPLGKRQCAALASPTLTARERRG